MLYIHWYEKCSCFMLIENNDVIDKRRGKIGINTLNLGENN